MVVYIPIYHCIMKLEQIWKNEILIGINFHFAIALSQCYNYKKRLQRTKFNGGLSMKCFTCKNQWWKKYCSQKISTSFQVVKSISNVFKTFVSTSYYNEDDDCNIFKLWFFSPLKI